MRDWKWRASPPVGRGAALEEAHAATPGIALVLITVVTLGCGGPVSGWPPAEHTAVKDVWVISHGWHTRVAVRRVDVDVSAWPEVTELGAVEYLEVGWGDRDFYPSPDPSLWDTLDPIVRSTAAALHVGGFDQAPAVFLRGRPIVIVRVPPSGFVDLTRFIHEHYVHDAAGRPVRIRPGYYERSWFYLAHGRYHALHNSNGWVLRALRAAGVPVGSLAWTAGSTMRQAAAVGQRLETAGPADH